MDHFISASANNYADNISHGPQESMASPICLLAVYYYKADISVMRNKRFLSFKEKRRELPFCIRSSNWRWRISSFPLIHNYAIFNLYFSDHMFGHASYAVACTHLLSLFFCSVVLYFTKYFFGLCGNLIFILVYQMLQFDRFMLLCFCSSKTVKVSI